MNQSIDNSISHQPLHNNPKCPSIATFIKKWPV